MSEWETVLDDHFRNLPPRGPSGSFQNRVRLWISVFGASRVRITPAMGLEVADE